MLIALTLLIRGEVSKDTSEKLRKVNYPKG